MTLSEKLKTSVGCAICIIAVYLIYICGSLYANGTMPDGVLFASMVGLIGTIFGIKLGKTIVEVSSPKVITKDNIDEDPCIKGEEE